MPGDINLYVSNGTCYIGQNEQADKAMIPCGNAANEHAACCQAGDNCLESSVCFNIDFGVTYVSGCTDPAYKHPSCPPKFLYQMIPATPWLGLSYCNGTSDEWVLCDQAQHPITLTEPDACWCPKDEDDRTATLSQSSVIPGTASLPTKILGSIQFSVGHYPTLNPGQETTPTTASDAATGQSSSALTNSPATPTAQTTATDLAAPPDQANETGPSPSPSAKIGAIAGGVAGALVLLLLLVGIMCLRRRRTKKRLQQQEEDRRVENFMNEGVTMKGGSATDPDPDPLNLGIGIAHGGLSPSPSSVDTSAVSELDSRAARPWSLRSELGNNNNNNNNHASSRGSSSTAGGSHGEAARRAPSELAAHPIAELPG
ncbi:hypothetical protein KVR01_001865 [Diaporthe batatas]|uniref:uncharacterized protein n=1 Tax=Diaporthe batatas TaxID=748121 RepID=UPI001D04F654|nr:uncharacterized protein KVR01_001865 [Diaporthe batatas]KAG8169116.1 hypothetical protein KVR01_001865 [Diaporthe batatas]